MPRDPLSASGGAPYQAAYPATQAARQQLPFRPAVPVEEILTLRIALGRDKVGTVPTRFRYEPARPYEVLVTFHLGRPDEVDWVFSRELLRDGLIGLTGQGDVRLWPAHCPCHGATLHLALESPTAARCWRPPRRGCGTGWTGRTPRCPRAPSRTARRRTSS